MLKKGRLGWLSTTGLTGKESKPRQSGRLAVSELNLGVEETDTFVVAEVGHGVNVTGHPSYLVI